MFKWEKNHVIKKKEIISESSVQYMDNMTQNSTALHSR